MTEHGDGSPRVDSRFTRHLTRRDFLKIGGGAIAGACASFSLGCADRRGSSSGAGSGGASAREPAGLWYEDNNMGTAGGMPPDFKEKFYRPDL